jgi:thiol-disulfide isomerase/thioredoxin
MSKPSGIILKASDFKIQDKKVFINSNKTNSVPGMLLIFATWCGHCHTFMPTFNEISNSLGSDYCCASIESEELKGQDKLTSALNFEGFPTICFFDQKGMILGQYEGNREKGAVLDTICKVYHHCHSVNHN